MAPGSITLSLIQNTAILLSFSMLYDLLWAKEEAPKNLYQKVLAGLCVGGIGLILMMTPWTLAPGLVFDTRSVLLSISGLFFGPLPVAIAMVVDGAYRVYLGGDGVWMGLGVILSSGTIGVLWRRFRPNWRKGHYILELLAMGSLVHIVMLGCAFLLPIDKVISIIGAIFLPILLVYSPGTMLLGSLMVSRASNWTNKKALVETKSLYISLVENMPAGVFRKSFDGRYDYVNSRFCELKGLTEKEILGKTPQEMAEYEEAKMATGTFVQSPRQRTLSKQGTDHHEWILHHGKPIIVEEVYPQKDGSLEYFQVVKTPVFDMDGKVIGSQGMQFDITLQKKSEEAILQEQYLLNSFLDNTPDLIYFKDLKSRFTRINRAHANLFGLTITNAAIGKTDFNFFTPEHAQKAYNDEQEIIRTGIPIINIVEKETWVDGRVTWAVTSKFPLINKERKKLGTFGASRDITMQKQLEADLLAAKEKAEEGDRLKTAFLHNISHEIRTPMNAIVGFSGFLNDPNLEPDKRAHFADIVVQSSNQLLSIIDDIVRIATIEAGQEKIHESEIQINSMCQLAFEQFVSKAKENKLDFKYKVGLPDAEAHVLTDETKLLQVISNLLVNAFKFTKWGHIYFGYTLKDKELEFFVEDSGIGIPEEMHDEIFKRFRQVESTLSRQFGGSGLGLSICKAYIELLGGRMWVTSKSGSGSIFYFTVPYRHAPLAERTPVIARKTRLSQQYEERAVTLLVAEDEDFNFMLLHEFLAPLKAIVLRATNGVEAVDLALENEEIDLVLMDLKMPVMDGYEATKRIKEFRPALPVMALTAYSQDSDRKRAMDSGCCEFISKPFNKNDLLTKIRTQLGTAVS